MGPTGSTAAPGVDRDADRRVPIEAMDVALVSCLHPPEPDPDEAPLAAGLKAAGIEAKVVAWDDPAADWSAPAVSALRSCWNYPHHVDAFSAWLADVAGKTDLWNPVSVVQWNLHKSYLLDLQRRGLPVTPTAVIRRGQADDVRRIARDRGWSEIVVKPAVSASSWRTLRAGPERYDVAQRHLDALVAERDALVQAFLPSVEDYGERSVVVVDGHVCHSVRKAPRFMDDVEVVSHQPMPVAPAEAELARRAVAAVEGPVFYARVDLAPGDDGAPMLMELELIEPSLFFDQGPEALDRYVSGVRRRLADRGR